MACRSPEEHPITWSAGSTEEAANLISGNSGTGVLISDTGTMNNRVEGNLIGTDVTGDHAARERRRRSDREGCVKQHHRGDWIRRRITSFPGTAAPVS